MRILTYIFETELAFSEPVRRHSFVLRCLPKSTNTQTVMESQVFTFPRIPLNGQVDGFGNRITLGYCPDKHTRFNFYATGQAMVSNDFAGKTPAHPVFLQPSKLTHPDEAIMAMATKLAGDPTCPPEESTAIWDTACRLSHGVFEAFTYEPGATNIQTMAAEALALGRGVCQDYAHVLIALCRACGIPARYVTGLMIGEGATHAWVEVHDGVRWRGLDPTNDRIVDDQYLLFATGRDFEDCPIERGVFLGNASQVQKVTATLSDNA